jgi:hypothetical protein
VLRARIRLRTKNIWQECESHTATQISIKRGKYFHCRTQIAVYQKELRKYRINVLELTILKRNANPVDGEFVVRFSLVHAANATSSFHQFRC